MGNRHYKAEKVKELIFATGALRMETSRLAASRRVGFGGLRCFAVAAKPRPRHLSIFLGYSIQYWRGLVTRSFNDFITSEIRGSTIYIDDSQSLAPL